jgi:SAM-dependent methyltransferase
VYDSLGRSYAATRRTEPRIAAQIWHALGGATSVLNVGAGTGSYEPADRPVVALEPSGVMLRQRPPGTAPAVQGFAEHLPFRDQSFDAAMAILTDHHWRDRTAGVRELLRVSRGPVVVLTWDEQVSHMFWMVAEYFPGIAREEVGLSDPAGLQSLLGPGARCEPVMVPADCVDGFMGAFWARPDAYLDPLVRAGISGFARLTAAKEADGVTRLRQDLASGGWQSRHAHLLERNELDVGYRLVWRP